MKHKRLLTFMCAFSMLLANGSALTAFAEETTVPETTNVVDENVRAAGLIMSYTLSASSGVKTLYISATTNGYDTMAKIGFTNIKIQRSANGTSGWTDEKTLSDQIATSSVYHILDCYSVSVTGGYYYRVVLDHYAKEQGWFFPSSQSVTNYSNVIWVPKS